MKPYTHDFIGKLNVIRERVIEAAQDAHRGHAKGEDWMPASRILYEFGVYVLPGHETVLLMIRRLVDIIRNRRGGNTDPFKQAWAECVERQTVFIRTSLTK